MEKNQLFLEVAADVVKFYAVMAHCLRFVMDEEVSEQMPLENVRERFQQIHAALQHRLAQNPVVRGKIEGDHLSTLKLLEAHQGAASDPARQAELREEALRLHYYARERSAALSDLVAVFRSL